MEGHSQTITPVFPGLPIEVAFKIFDELDDQSLLSCRLVSKGWCEASSNYLQSRSAVVVKLWCHSSLEEKRSLASFIKCFNKSREFRHTFPYVNFSLIGRSSKYIFNCPALKQFLALQKSSSGSGSGLLIKCLCLLHIDNCATTLVKLKHLVFNETPNLRKIGIKFKMFSQESTSKTQLWDETGSDATERALPSLQVLQLDNLYKEAHIKFVASILRAAPNIKRIVGMKPLGTEEGPYQVCSNHLQMLISAQKLHLVNQCKIFLGGFHDFGNLTRESGFHPTLLDLNCLRDGTKTVLRELLEIVKDVVEELRVDDGLGLLDKCDFPRLSKLRRLSLNLRTAGYPLLPPGIMKLESLPKLEEIRFTLPSSIDLNNLLPSGSHISVHSSVLYSVKIVIDESRPTEFSESITTMCPNLQNLELSYSHMMSFRFIDSDWVNLRFWNIMKGLRTLTLTNIGLDRVLTFEKLEAWFTGFSLRTVLRLQATKPEEWPRVEDVEHLRINPSILQLTELKKLKISAFKGSCPLPTLPVSSKYAFGLKPDLTVEISFQKPDY